MFQIFNLMYKDILDIDELQIRKDLVTCIVGESGSGKSTLLKMLNKILTPDSGEILYQGKPLADINTISLRRQVAMLSQSPAIYDGNIRDNLLIGRKFAGQAAVADEVLERILQTTKLDKSLDEGTGKLSGGEQQRLVLARILLLDANVLMLDEPSSGLDEGTEHEVIKAVSSYAKEMGKTIIMVTHSKKLVSDFADEIVELKDGTILKGVRT